mmetsp:Transcript_59502/g.160360  ORF Transcript_59502/g.160360 Transcript_59502/m.160360 type:complete len:224 (-) Transcript_59502:348-1019(-)
MHQMMVRFPRRRGGKQRRFSDRAEPPIEGLEALHCQAHHGGVCEGHRPGAGGTRPDRRSVDRGSVRTGVWGTAGASVMRRSAGAAQAGGRRCLRELFGNGRRWLQWRCRPTQRDVPVVGFDVDVALGLPLLLARRATSHDVGGHPQDQHNVLQDADAHENGEQLRAQAGRTRGDLPDRQANVEEPQQREEERSHRLRYIWAAEFSTKLVPAHAEDCQSHKRTE